MTPTMPKTAPAIPDPAAGMRSCSVVVAALGGEGGGVLTDWIVRAAIDCGFPVQSTSIPGVAQRTGATTYYIEFMPVRHEDLGGRTPLFGLYPVPGEVDVVLASEILEAGRAMERGFASPDRTTLIASTHRVFAISEKSAMGDGRFDHRPLEKAIDAVARRSFLTGYPADCRAGRRRTECCHAGDAGRVRRAADPAARL